MSAKHVRPKTPNRLQKYIKTPKGYVFLTLVLLTFLASFHSADRKGCINAIIAVIGGIGFDYMVAVWKKQNRRFSDGALVTALLIADILSSNTSWVVVLIATWIALASKHLLKMKKKPIFNPAAFGLLAALIFFSTGQSWWGSLSMLPGWCVVFLIIAGFLVAKRVNKLPIVFTFLGTYFALLFLMALFHLGLPSDTPGDALRDPFINSALYLAFFMLTDPPTSPAKYKQQVFFGFLSALVGTIIFTLQGGLAYLLLGLLVANGWKVWKIHRTEQATQNEKNYGKTQVSRY